jgi:tRNA threonylcarbamoyladenosine biosynthesis protein TsaE
MNVRDRVSTIPDIDIVSHGIEQTRRLGAHLGNLLHPGSIILLEGEFGTGKTSFTQGIAAGLGIDSRYVNSPTFTLINEYKGGRLPLYHIDLYRLEGVKDVATLGLDDYLDGSGVTVIEWPQGATPWLPGDRLTVRFAHLSETKRTIRFYSSGAPYRSLTDEFKKGAYGP